MIKNRRGNEEGQQEKGTKKSEGDCSNLFLQVETAIFISGRIPLAVNKTSGTVQVAVQNHFA